MNKQKLKEYNHRFYLTHKKEKSLSNKEWIKKNPEKWRAIVRKSKFGVTKDTWAAWSKDGCQICGRIATHVDHDHRTGQTRGALCNKCNLGLGLFDDNSFRLKAAWLYVRERINNEIPTVVSDNAKADPLAF